MRKFQKQLLGVLCFVVCFGSIFSQHLRHPVSAPYIMSGAYSRNHADVFSFANNQAVLAQYHTTAVGLYTERRFLLKETSVHVVSAALPTSLGNFGSNIFFSGFANFREMQAGFAYAREIGSLAAIGVQFNYYSFQVPSYFSDHALLAEAGLLFYPTGNVIYGIHIYNPTRGGLGKTGYRLPYVFSTGVGYDISDSFFSEIELQKEEGQPADIRVSVRYDFIKRFFARGGASTLTSSGYAGVGVAWSNIQLDINTSYHSVLGLSPGIMLIIHPKPKKAAPAND